MPTTAANNNIASGTPTPAPIATALSSHLAFAQAAEDDPATSLLLPPGTEGAGVTLDKVAALEMGAQADLIAADCLAALSASPEILSCWMAWGNSSKRFPLPHVLAFKQDH